MAGPCHLSGPQEVLGLGVSSRPSTGCSSCSVPVGRERPVSGPFSLGLPSSSHPVLSQPLPRPLPTDPRHPCPGADSLPSDLFAWGWKPADATRPASSTGSWLSDPVQPARPAFGLAAPAGRLLPGPRVDVPGVAGPTEQGSSAGTETRGLSRRARAPNSASATRAHKRRLPPLLFCPSGVCRSDPGSSRAAPRLTA